MIRKLVIAALIAETVAAVRFARLVKRECAS